MSSRAQEVGGGSAYTSYQESLASIVREKSKTKRRYKDLTEREKNTFIVKELIGEKNWDDRMDF